MKKLISTIILVCMVFTAFSTVISADKLDITSVTYTSSGTFFTISVNGVCDAGDNITIRIKNKSGDVRALKQFKVKDADTFTYSIKVNTVKDEALTETDGSLVYAVYVRNNDNENSMYQLPLYTEANKRKIIDEKFNTASTITDMETYIEGYAKVFGFDMTNYANAKDDVAEFMIKNRKATPFNLENIAALFDDSVIRAYLFNEDKTADRTFAIEYNAYAEKLQFETGFDGEDSLYPEYKKMVTQLKAKVNEIVFTEENSMLSFPLLKEKFFMAITKTVMLENKEEIEKVYGFLKDYNGWYKFDGLEELLTYDAQQIVDGLLGSEIPDNQADFAKLYDDIKAEVCVGEPVKKPATGGSGGGGGGGAGGISNTPAEEIGYEKPEEIEEIKPIEAVSFDDLSGYDWAKESILMLAEKGIVNGKEKGKFAPADNITREEFAKILTIAYGIEGAGDCDFADVDKERWSYQYISAMYENGIITGYPDGTFKPSANVTREEMAVMLCRVLLRVSKIEIEYETSSTYKDYAEVSEFAQNSVRTLSTHNILSGDDRGFFNPKKGATRAEVCKMICNAGL